MNKNRTTGSYKTLVETTGSLSEAISLKEKIAIKASRSS